MKQEVKVTDEAGNVQQCAVMLSFFSLFFCAVGVFYYVWFSMS